MNWTVFRTAVCFALLWHLLRQDLHCFICS